MTRRPLFVALVALVALVVALAACSAPGRPLERLYRELREDDQAEIGDAGDARALAKRQRARIAEVRALRERGEIEGPADHLHAAAIAASSEELADLDLAEELALEAARLGEDRGFRVAAEAIDRRQVKLALPQRFGTQYVWDVPTARWKLYPVDPRTSDAERAAMGVPPVSELLAAEVLLNATEPAPK